MRDQSRTDRQRTGPATNRGTGAARLQLRDSQRRDTAPPARAAEPGQPTPIAAGPAFSFDKIAVVAGSPRDSAPEPEPLRPHEIAAQGIGGVGRQLPFLDSIQRSFGRHDISEIKAHTDAQAGRAARALGAAAFATGSHVVFDGVPSLNTAAHEAAHVVQQRSGLRLAGGIGQPGDPFERNADAVAERVTNGRSAADLLDQYAGSGGGEPVIQRSIPASSAGAARGAGSAPKRDTPPLRDAATPKPSFPPLRDAATQPALLADPREARLSAADQDNLAWIRADPEFELASLGHIQNLRSELPGYVQKALATQQHKSGWLSFLAGMMPYFGGQVGAVLNHFGQIKRVDGQPDEVYLHGLASKRLEYVTQTLRQAGKIVPSTNVGFSFRDDVGPHSELHGQTYYSHRLGLAVDYRAPKNPQLKDSRLVQAVTTLTGRKSAGVELGKGYQQTIASIGKKSAAAMEAGQTSTDQPAPAPQFTAKEQELLDKMQTAYAELAEASRKVKAQFGDPETIKKFEDLRRTYLGLKDIKDPAANKAAEAALLLDMQKLLAPLSKKIEEAAEEKVAMGDGSHVEFPRPALMLPQLDVKLGQKPEAKATFDESVVLSAPNFELDPALGKLLRQHYSRELGRSVLVQQLPLTAVIRGPIAGLTELVTWFGKKLGATKSAADASTRALSGLNARARAAATKRVKDDDVGLQIESVQARLRELARDRATAQHSLELVKSVSDANQWYYTFTKLLHSVNNDPQFVLIGDPEENRNTATRVADPSLRQVLTQGWINPDAPHQPGTKPETDKYGFNQDFMQTMIRFGFDFAVAWGEDRLGKLEDPQHFQLHEGFANVTAAAPFHSQIASAVAAKAAERKQKKT